MILIKISTLHILILYPDHSTPCHFLPFFRDHLRAKMGIICGTVWRSFAVLGSFADLYSTLRWRFIVLILFFFSAVATEDCYMEDWSSSISKKGESMCSSPNGYGYYYLKGLERDGTGDLRGIKKAKCCVRDQTFWGLPTMCQMPNWKISMDRLEFKLFKLFLRSFSRD